MPIRFAIHPGRLYDRRKVQKGETPGAARQALKGRLATVVYDCLVAETEALAASTAPPSTERAA